MKIGYFTERPYRWIPEDEVFKNHAFFAASNHHPYEQEPGILRAFAGANRLPVVDRDPLPSLGLQF